jgi:hypothetical protein
MDDCMERPRAWLIAGLTAVLMFGGCCSKESSETINRICAQGVDKQAVMDAAQRVLEDMHFTIEKADLDAGYISTRPLAAQQFFELWRSDTVGCGNFAEANLHSVTRTAEINVAPQDDDFCLTCKVATRRLSVPDREISSATELPKVFTKSAGGLQTLQLGRDAVWMDMGNDPALEARILERIQKLIERQI